jgi:uncharacterized protein YkwD
MKLKFLCLQILLTFCIIASAQQARKPVSAKKTTTVTKKPFPQKTTAVKKTAAATKKPVAQKTITAKKKTETKTVSTAKTAKPLTAVKEPVPGIVPAKNLRPSKQPANQNITVADLNMSNNEKKMVDEINLVRSNPRSYVKYIEAYVKKSAPSSKSLKQAAQELINELSSMEPLNTLSISAALYIDARQFGKELIENNAIEHSSLPYAENLVFESENVRDAVIDLLIDEGVEGNGHRKNILKKKASLVAVYEIPGKVDGFSFGYIQEFK